MSEKGQLYFGGEIYTVDDANPTADAVAVMGGKIIAVGPEDECRSALGTDYESTDLQGKALLPGFIDSHMHPVVLAFFDMNIDLRNETSIEEIQQAIRAGAESDSSENWIAGLQFDEQNLRDPRLLNRHDLDEACPDRPANNFALAARYSRRPP